MRAWYDVFSAVPLSNSKKAAEEFYRSKVWSGGFGGPAWGKAANYLAEFLEGNYTPVMFVDLVIDLEHNMGCIFNKWFDDTPYLKKILDAKFSGKDEDFEILLTRVTKSDIKVAYLNSLRSGKRQRVLAKQFVLDNDMIKQIRFKHYNECAKCGIELNVAEKVCTKCITCPMCHGVISLPLGQPMLPEAVYHTCPTVKIEIPSIKYVRD